LPDIIKTLEYTSHLVKTWGLSRLSNGITLSEVLSLNDIPFWDAFAVDLARIYMPAALFADKTSSKISRRIKPYLIRAKYGLLDFIRNRYNTQGCSLWPPGKTILCLDFSEYISRDVLQPLVTHLTEQKGINVVFVRDKSWANVSACSHQNGLYHQTVWEHWGQQASLQVSKLREELYRIECYLRASNDLMNIICSEDRCICKKLENVFNRFFRADLPILVPRAVAAQHILKNHRPALVISPDVADPRTRVYTLLCRQMGIPCLEVQFGLTGAEGIEWQFFSADKVAAWGENSKEVMRKHGIADEKIVITGSPRHDCLVNVSDAEVESMRANLRVPKGSAIVVLASAYQLPSYDAYSNPELLILMKRALFEAAGNSQGICLVVKPHPVENVRQTRSLAGKYKNIVFVSRKSDIRELTRICDAFVSFGSTATVDAFISGKLVICPVFPGWIWSDNFKNSGAALVPTSAAEVLEIFRLISDGAYHGIKAKLEPARKELLAQWVHRADGLAAERIAELALQMAKEKI
jgi:CDP-Glycerol:Poly(glycerophosphate) glycerophosphotransferase